MSTGSFPLVGYPEVIPLPATRIALRALVVDDNTTNRLLLTRMLKSWGVLPEEAGDASQALSLLTDAAERKHPYHLVLLGLQMPGIDGIQLARSIHADDRLSGARLVLLTSLGQRAVCASFSQAGIAACLTKPVRERQLFLTLNQLIQSAVLQVEPKREPVKARPADSTAPRILIAEDNAINQKLVLHYLARLGLSADAVSTGRAALEAVQLGCYELILMDCHMPEMDGFEATESIRRLSGALNSIPIVAVTANAMKGDRERCLAAGMNGYLSKPFKPEELSAVLRNQLSRSPL